jgi:heme/copper-type cytochrome/quinol oxidase subunit 1
MVSLNLAVSLRGVSDRWTHGLGAMTHQERVVTMAVAAWMVGWGLAALRSLPQPQLGYYGATRRLEEISTRRLALGATFTVAAVGMVAGVLPGGLPA